MKTILLIVLTVTPIFCWLGRPTQKIATSTVLAQDTSPLQIKLLADKTRYKRNEEVWLSAMVMNQSLREVYVYGNLEWGPHASFTLCVRDSSGKNVPPKFIADAITHFENPDDISQFVKLLPYHLLGNTFDTSPTDLNINRPGKYSIYAEYHSPISNPRLMLNHSMGKRTAFCNQMLCL